MRAFYFTAAKWALDNIAKRRVKVSLFPELNDPFELLALDLTDPTNRNMYRDAVEYCVSQYGVVCLSRSSSNPLLWGHYGDRHRGICLGFDLLDDLVMPISYSPERLRPAIDASSTLNEMQAIVKQVFSTKFKDWAYEDEVRAWINLDERDESSGLFFAQFGEHLRLREVILGVRCETSFEDVLASTSGLDDVRIFAGQLSFATFGVEKLELMAT